MDATHNCVKSANHAMSGGAMASSNNMASGNAMSSHNAMSGGAMAKSETNCDTHMQHNNSMSHLGNMSGQQDSMDH
jgi:hypothetical protein